MLLRLLLCLLMPRVDPRAQALERAWDGCDAVYLSFDIDVIEAGFVPGTGWPEPGGLLPREALKMVGMVAADAAREIVIVPPSVGKSSGCAS